MIRVVSDSGANLNADLRIQHNIGVVPLQVLFGTHCYRDEVDLSNAQFMHLLTHEKTHPTTSAPSPADFINVWQPILDAGDEVVCLCIPSGLSATYSSAVNAVSQLEHDQSGPVPVSLVDSRWVSMAQGFQALRGADAAAAGGSREQVIDAMTALDDKLVMIFLVDTLEFLKRGGRIGKAQAWFGTLLNVKPILEIAHARVEPLERVRSQKAGIARMLDLVQNPPVTNGPRKKEGPLHVAILHARAPEAAQRIENGLCARFEVAELVITDIGPTIAVHSGPGAVGLAFYRD